MEFEKGPLKELHTIITYRAVTNYAKDDRSFYSKTSWNSCILQFFCL